MTSLTVALSGSGFSWTAAAGVMSFWPTGPTHKHTNTRKSAVAAVILHTLKHTHILSNAHPIKQSVGTTSKALLPS